MVLENASGSDISSTYLTELCNASASRVTLPQAKGRRGSLANTSLAVRSLCCKSESVIITLDLDDALIRKSVLSTLTGAYAARALLTVGRMFKTGKPDASSMLPVNFCCCQYSRGAGNT